MTDRYRKKPVEVRAEAEPRLFLTGEDDAWCAECGVKLEIVRPGKYQHPTCSQAALQRVAVMNKSIPEDVMEAVARAICVACEENPDHQGDARGNEFRWQDYRDVALAAISAFTAEQQENSDA